MDVKDPNTINQIISAVAGAAFTVAGSWAVVRSKLGKSGVSVDKQLDELRGEMRALGQLVAGRFERLERRVTWIETPHSDDITPDATGRDRQ